MRNSLIGLVLLCATTQSSPVLAYSAEVEPSPARLQRRQVTEVRDRQAKIGVQVVEILTRLGRPFPETIGDSGKIVAIICSTGGGFNYVFTLMAIQAAKGLPEDARARLRAADPEQLDSFLPAIVGLLDGRSAQEIKADEAIEPGAYHHVLIGAERVLKSCDFLATIG